MSCPSLKTESLKSSSFILNPFCLTFRFLQWGLNGDAWRTHFFLPGNVQRVSTCRWVLLFTAALIEHVVVQGRTNFNGVTPVVLSARRLVQKPFGVHTEELLSVLVCEAADSQVGSAAAIL